MCTALLLSCPAFTYWSWIHLQARQHACDLFVCIACSRVQHPACLPTVAVCLRADRCSRRDLGLSMHASVYVHTLSNTYMCARTSCRNLGLDCSVLMGGNVAVDVGKHQLSEAVVGECT